MMRKKFKNKGKKPMKKLIRGKMEIKYIDISIWIKAQKVMKAKTNKNKTIFREKRLRNVSDAEKKDILQKIVIFRRKQLACSVWAIITIQSAQTNYVIDAIRQAMSHSNVRQMAKNVTDAGKLGISRKIVEQL